MILLPQLLSQADLAHCIQLARFSAYTTVRGPFAMASLDPSALEPLGPVLAFLDGEKAYGTYIIRYRVGASKPAHLDPPPFAQHLGHDRLVCLLQASEEGGELRFEGELVRLGLRDGVLFRADLISHSIDPVLKGERIVLTVGRIARKEPWSPT